MNSSKKNWLFALGLTTPMLIFFAAYLFYHPSDLLPTGFIQYDNVSYIANARQYLDADKFSAFYSNSFNDSGHYNAIYFQSQSYLFAIAMKTGIPPDSILIFFSILCTFFCFRILIAIFDHLVSKPKNRAVSVILFAWGGGLLVLSGALAYLFNFTQAPNLWDSLLLIDPGYGWWGLSLGRSLFISCEAYYHLLFLLVILFILKQKWNLSLLFTFILAVSHPFTSIELLCILCCWLLLEKIIIRNKNIPWFFAISIAGLTGLLLWYYLYYLNQFADHRSFSEQHALNWYIRIVRMIPAYAIAGTLAGFTLVRLRPAFLNSFYNRLFICWFFVAFLLAKHELFIKPMQPIHFTRGYIWTSLFLIGIPALEVFFAHIQRSKYKTYILSVFIFIFLLDNFTWILRYVISYGRSKSVTYITSEEHKILNIISKNSNNNTLLIGYSSGEEILPYLSLVYSNAYSWLSHPFTTPFVTSKTEAYNNFIKKGIIYPTWENREVIFIFRKKDSLEMNRAHTLEFPDSTLIETPSYIITKARIPVAGPNR